MRAEFFDQNKNKKRRGKIPVTKLAISKTGNIKNCQYYDQNWQYQKLAI